MEKLPTIRDSLAPPLPVSSDVSLADQQQPVWQASWNETAAEYPRNRCIHELFEVQAGRTPEAVAVVFEGTQLNYRQLNERANQLAHHLRQLGVKPDTLVGLAVHRSAEMIIGLLGILKAGGAYVPLDSKSPKSRLQQQLKDLKVLVAQAKSMSHISAFAGKIVCLDRDQHEFQQLAKNNPDSNTTSENLVYVIYTSGSTGNPKGVMIPHRNLVNYTCFMSRRLTLSNFDEGLKFALVSSIAADLGNTCIYPALLSGGSLHLVESDLALNPEAFARYMTHHAIDVLKITPSHFSTLIGTSDPVRVLPKRFLVLGGEVLTTKLVRHIQNLSGTCRIINHYGPTETTVGSLTLSEDEFGVGSLTSSSIPIGRPIANTRCYILDERLEPVAVGVAGELHIGGDGVARGYLNRPELTAEKFIADPFSKVPGERLYKTGDLARYLPDGNIEFLGRVDQQVKLRGFRIELGEIEAVLGTHPEVLQSVVVAREEVPGEKTLVAYLVGRREPGPTVTELREFLSQKLPDYMVPAAFVTLEKLPLTPNGKIDRQALPAPAKNRQVLGGQWMEPRTPTEMALAKIWAELLDLNPIGILDNFFALGGHSLLAVRIIFRIRETCKVEMPVRMIFEFPTIAKLAQAVDNAMVRLANDSLYSPRQLVRMDRSTALSPGKFATSYGQEQLWFLDQLEPGSSVYNVSLTIRLRGHLDQTVLKQSLNHLIDRHEVLRTTFEAENGLPMQVVAPRLAIELAVIPTKSRPEAEREVELQKMLQASATRSFDLQRGPLLRAELFVLGDENNVLLLTIHHTVFDGWSADLLLRELAKIYSAFCDGRTPELPELPVQYVDFAAWQRQGLTAERLQYHLNYWRHQLAGVPTVLALPSNQPARQVVHRRGGQQYFTVPVELAAALRELSRQQDTTLFVVLLAAFQVLLYRYTNQQNVLVGSPMSGRTSKEAEDLIGFFVNTLPLRADFSGHPRFTELLQQIHKTVWEAQDHQDLPFEKLVEDLHPERELGRNPIFQIAFLFENASSSLNQMGAVRLERENLRTPIVKFDLTLSLIEKDGRLRGAFEYATEIFDTDTISRLSAHYQNLLAAIVANPSQAVSALPLLSTAEHQQLVAGWNETVVEYPRDRCVHELFEAQAERTPEAVAVVFEDTQLTYRQLNERANQLAHHLRQLGVEPDTLVGLAVDRSADYLVSVLAVLKASGAYLPLDMSYPVKRLQFMLVDSGVRVILTNQPLPVDLDQHGLTTVDLKTGGESIDSCAKHNPDNRNAPENLAYVIYTSGSTGQPKGVAITHRGVVRLVRGQDYLKFDSRQRFLLLASTAFDAATFETWGPLLNGARCVIFAGQTLDLKQLEATIRRHGVTCIFLTTGLFNQIIDVQPTTLETVGYVLTGGEMMSVSHIQKAIRRLPGLQFTNIYGPTESTTFACFHPIEPTASFAAGSIPIGRPIANTRCYILDERLGPVAVGVAGELHIGGDGVARGYLNRPELTAEKFIADPFSKVPGERLYKTGDLARYLPEGNIEFLGRVDQQVKLRGFRIELGEIEAVLGTHPELLQSVVVAREDVPGEKTLVAYLVGRREPGPTVTELREFLSQKLPDYMVPAAFVTLEKLPLTPNGKIDRQALPAPAKNRQVLGGQWMEPRTPTEMALAKIWAELLNLNPIGIHDNFFALGGHSLLAVRMVNQIKRDMKLDLPIKTLFQHPTIGALAQMLSAQSQKGGERVPELIQLQPGKCGPNLFFLIDDGSLGLFKLGRLLNDCLPIYASVVPLPDTALKASLKNNRGGLPRMEDLAAGHVALIKSRQTAGPVVLAGHCFGGLLAFEVAQQLQASGIRVEAVLLLDTWMTRPKFWWKKRTWVREHMGKLLKLGPRYLWRKSRRRIKLEKNRLVSRFELSASDDFSVHVPWVIIARIYRQAMKSYRPKALESRGIMYLSQDDWMANAFRKTDDSLGANKMFADGVEVINVPGNHVTILDEAHLPELAATFKKSLEPFQRAPKT